MTTHIHHIIPKHMGGTNDPKNLVELTIAEHAEAHRILYEQHGLLQDKLAWHGLLGLITTAEIVYTLRSEGMKGSKNPMFGKSAPNRGVKRPGVGGRKKGTTWSQEERENRMRHRSTEEYKNQMKKVYENPERNSKIAAGRKGIPGAAAGKAWYNNGIEEKYFLIGNELKGYNRGRLNRK